jgi:transcription elongation factor Elf1
VKGPMKLIDASSGLMECQVCGLSHSASIQSGLERADGSTRYYRGSYQCSNEQCPSNQKEWNGSKRRYVKPNWRELVQAVAI